jgi:cell division protein FtsL
VSVPARRLPAPDEPDPAPRIVLPRRPPRERAARSARTPAARPTRSSPPQNRARRGSHLAFWIFAGLLVAALGIGIVAVNAVVVNTTYRLRSIQQETRALAEDAEDREIEVAHLSSPSRVASWAQAQGMVLPLPEDVVPLAVPGGAREERA